MGLFSSDGARSPKTNTQNSSMMNRHSRTEVSSVVTTNPRPSGCRHHRHRDGMKGNDRFTRRPRPRAKPAWGSTGDRRVDDVEVLPLREHRGNRHKHDDGEQALEQHRAVPDPAAVALLRDLPDRGPARHQRVEAADAPQATVMNSSGQMPAFSAPRRWRGPAPGPGCAHRAEAAISAENGDQGNAAYRICTLVKSAAARIQPHRQPHARKM